MLMLNTARHKLESLNFGVVQAAMLKSYLSIQQLLPLHDYAYPTHSFVVIVVVLVIIKIYPCNYVILRTEHAHVRTRVACSALYYFSCSCYYSCFHGFFSKRKPTIS